MSNSKRIQYQLKQIAELVARWGGLPEHELNYRLSMVLRAMYMLDSDTTFEFTEIKDAKVLYNNENK